MAKHLQLGKDGEQAALQFLQKKGYELVWKNWKVGPLEVDLIMRDGGVLVFVEVKTRTRMDYGLPYESVNRQKQAKLLRAANKYLEINAYEGEIRFDIVSIFALKGNTFDIRHIPDAFWPYR
ncbi:YraN family protein [Olivibacter sitiensis]|uniref:YraN family protein n=1 Tax=Olivibacter sitiensis TaxID=376470 RepID=UPI00042501FF|nr:YraN family protein [Olivibacter sitiensis]